MFYPFTPQSPLPFDVCDTYLITQPLSWKRDVNWTAHLLGFVAFEIVTFVSGNMTSSIGDCYVLRIHVFDDIVLLTCVLYPT